MRSAVLVIDVQQGLCEGPGAASNCEAVIGRINRVTRKGREAGVPVIFIQHESNAGYLERGTPAWRLATGLSVQPGDITIPKTTPDSFLRTTLEAMLRAHDVEHVIVCGMHTEFCVDTTVRRALALGYPVTLVDDAHTSAGNHVLTPEQVIQHHNVTLTEVTSFGPRVTTVSTQALAIDPARELGFRLRFQTPDRWSDAEHRSFWEACIGEVERLGLTVGGGSGPGWDLFVAGRVTPAKRANLLAWLAANPDVTELAAGALEDAGSADRDLRGVG
jgi:nicotinamidase-related amidase/uncharacterized protein YggL (DUF469 family)